MEMLDVKELISVVGRGGPAATRSKKAARSEQEAQEDGANPRTSIIKRWATKAWISFKRLS